VRLGFIRGFLLKNLIYKRIYWQNFKPSEICHRVHRWILLAMAVFLILLLKL